MAKDITGPPDPNTTYPPAGDKAAWAEWWLDWNRRWAELYRTTGADPCAGLEEINGDQQGATA
jgi:hypothetical protein